MMSTLSSAIREHRSSRTLLLVSLALNLFFAGAAGTLVVRHYLTPAAVAPATTDRSAAARIERLAATLPASDADILRAEFRTRMTAVEASQATYRQAQDRIRETLRAEPFAIEALRTTMAQTRAARQGYEQSLHELIAAAAAKMSKTGRDKLADWPLRQRGTNEASRSG